MERERYQLVISLGEGAEGQRLRGVLDAAAERTGKPISAWARHVLLTAAGDAASEGPVDPIIEVLINGREMTTLDLRAVSAMQNGWTNKIRALIGSTWIDLGTNNPDEIMRQWKRVRRWGLV